MVERESGSSRGADLCKRTIGVNVTLKMFVGMSGRITPGEGPGSHSCGNKKGRREKFPKRKEEKGEKRISLDLLCSTV